MGVTHNLTRTVKTNSEAIITGQWSEVANSEVNVDVTIAASQTNSPVTCAFVLANVKSLFILSSQAVTLKTNSTSSPGNTISLKAGIPLEWTNSAGYYSIPFAADVTILYITTTIATRLQIKVLTN
jgi:hypothetical protein